MSVKAILSKRLAAAGGLLTDQDRNLQHSAIETRWVVGLLRVAFGLAVINSWAACVAASLPFGFLTVAAAGLVIAFSFTSIFERFWKAIALSFCLYLVADWTWITMLGSQQVPLFVGGLMVLTATCAFVPWGPRWQGVLTGACLILAGVDSVVVRPVSPVLGYLWMGLLAVSVVAMAGSVLLSQWREAVAETNRRLVAEIAKTDRSQKQLEESESNLRKIFDACPDIISVNSLADRRYINVNQQFSVTGYSKFEALGGSLETLGIWADDTQLRKFMSALTTNGVVHNMEADLLFKDGTPRPCLVSGALVDLDCEPCVVTFATEITHLKQTERELTAAREAAVAASLAKSEFLCGMSHELRTPMNAILGMAEVLSESSLSPEQRGFVDTMTSNGNSLLYLINSILDLAKVESGKMRLEKTEFDLEELVEQAAETHSVQAHGKGLEIVTRLQPDLPIKVVGDPYRLRQVLNNLLSNAIKFTQQGEVLLEVENSAEENEPVDADGGERQLRFSVRDSGIGIPRDTLKEILGATKPDSPVTRTRRYGGSGLGLAIARRLVDLMGGSIAAESNVGWGSTFSFDAHFKAEGTRAWLDEPNLAGLRVLLVDDNATSRSVIRDILNARGAIVAEVGNGKKALAKSDRARREGDPFDLVLLDASLQDIDGLLVAELLKRDADGPKSIMMMLTADNIEAKLSRLQNIGIEHHVVKPLKRNELINMVAEVTGRNETADSSAREGKVVQLIADGRGAPSVAHEDTVRTIARRAALPLRRAANQ